MLNFYRVLNEQFLLIAIRKQYFVRNRKLTIIRIVIRTEVCIKYNKVYRNDNKLTKRKGKLY